MHFGERHSQLLPFCEYVFVPGKSPVEVQPEILGILLRKVHVVRIMDSFRTVSQQTKRPTPWLLVLKKLYCDSCINIL
jgi:hypothetical protein